MQLKFIAQFLRYLHRTLPGPLSRISIWKISLTQNMQDRQIQVRAGSARAVGKLRETAGMMMGRSDATAQWAPACIIQPEEVSIAAESSPSWTATRCLSSQSDPHCLFSRFILALLPSAGGKFHKTGEGVLSACPHHSTQRGRGCSAYYTSLLPLLSLRIHVALPLCPSKSHHF